MFFFFALDLGIGVWRFFLGLGYFSCVGFYILRVVLVLDWDFERMSYVQIIFNKVR